MYLIALLSESGETEVGLVDNETNIVNIMILGTLLGRIFYKSLSIYQQRKLTKGRTIIIQKSNKLYNYIKTLTK